MIIINGAETGVWGLLLFFVMQPLVAFTMGALLAIFTFPLVCDIVGSFPRWRTAK